MNRLSLPSLILSLSCLRAEFALAAESTVTNSPRTSGDELSGVREVRAQKTEVLISAVTAIGVGALAAGVLALTGSVDAAGVIAVGGLGAAAGAGLGWRSFGTDTVIIA